MPGIADFLAYTEEERKKSIPKAAPVADMTPRGGRQSSGGGSDASDGAKHEIVNETARSEGNAAQAAQQAVTDAFTQRYDAVAATPAGKMETAPNYDRNAPKIEAQGSKLDDAAWKASTDDLKRQQVQGNLAGMQEREDLMHPTKASEAVPANSWGWIDDLQKEADKAKEEDERVRRSESHRRYLAGIGDAFSSLANLYYTTKGSPNQVQTYASPLVNQSIERERARRKNEYDQIVARLDAARTAKERFDTQREVAALKRSASSDPARLEYLNRKLDWEQKKHYSDHDIKERKLELDTAYRDKTITLREYQAETARLNAIAANKRAGNAAANSGPKPMKDADARSYRRQNISGLKEEIAKSKGYSSWSAFADSNNRGNLTKEEKAMIAALNSTKPNEQDGAINQYGSLAPGWQAQMQSATGGGAAPASGANNENSGNSPTSTPPWVKKSEEKKNERPW